MKLIVETPDSPAREIDLSVPSSARVAVMMSGGVDSTALLYLLNQMRKEGKFQSLTAFTLHKPSYLEAVEKIKHYPGFEGINWSIVENTDEMSGRAWNAMLKVKSRDDVDLLFEGTTAVAENVGIEGIAPNRLGLERSKSIVKYKAPFLGLTKDYTVKLYVDRVVPREILALTRTCGNYDGEPCGLCYPCNERRWAFNKFNIPMNGTFND